MIVRRILPFCIAISLLAPQSASATALPAAKVAPHQYTVNIGIQITGDISLIGKTNVEINKFFPDKITIHTGDKIRFVNAVPNYPQTVTFGPALNTPALLPSAAQAEVNNLIAAPRGGTSVKDPSINVYTSGVLMRGVRGSRTQYTFTFPVAGTYTYRSLFHPESQGLVVVVPSGAPVSSDPPDQSAALYGALRSLVETVAQVQAANATASGGSVQIGSGNGDVSVQGFLPPISVIHVGQSIQWSVSETSGDPHALVFGQTTANESQGLVPQYTGFASDGGLQVNQGYWKPSLVSGGTVITSTVFQGTKRWTSGILYQASPTYPSAVPSQYSLTFQVQGSFQYVDPFHRGMVGTVVVLP